MVSQNCEECCAAWVITARAAPRKMQEVRNWHFLTVSGGDTQLRDIGQNSETTFASYSRISFVGTIARRAWIISIQGLWAGS